MADVLKFDPARRALSAQTTHEEEFGFWPEVSRGLWAVSDPQPVDPANRQGRVLLEMVLILAATAAIAAAVLLFAGAPLPA
jgi:hypothetical protein